MGAHIECLTQDGSKEDRQTMSRKTYKTIETPSGSGELRKAGAHLAKVFYHRKTRRWDSTLRVAL
jgi:hypothetical protein